MAEKRKRGTIIRPRAFLLGFVLAVLICALTPFNNAYRNATPLGGGYFPLAPFYVLFWLTLITALSGKFFKAEKLLTGTELIFTWGLMVLVSGIAYTGFARTFFINLTAPFYFSSVENQWAQVFEPLLPRDLFPRSPAAIELLYNGITGGRDMGWLELAAKVPWHAWILPFLSWGFFICIAYFLILCLIHMVSRQAMENERMNFPLLILPRMIQKAVDNQSVSGFFTNPYLILGMSLPVCLHLLNGLHFYFPSFPQINTLVLAGPYFPRQGIFAGFVKLKLYFYPAFIGFAFLASKQVSFSFWFFFILGAFLTGILSIAGLSFPASELGTTFGPTLALPEETQMIGAFIVFALFLAWLARFHFKEMVKNAFDFNPQNPHPEQVGDKIAFWGTAFGFTALTVWFLFHGVGLAQSVLLIFFFILFTMVATRVVCQGGVTYFTLNVAPLDAINTIFGLRIFSGLGMVLAGVSQKVMFVDLRESVAPSILHLLRITRRVRGQGAVACSIFLVMGICLMVSAMAMILLCYKYGIRELQLDWATRTTVSMYNNIFPLIEHGVEQGNSIRIFTVAGALVMAVLVICYHRFYWWPLHPIGYLMVYSSAMRILWVSFFLGWLFNTLCMRYGGISFFRRMRLFFVGLIMGDFLMGGTWAMIGMFTETGYQVLPN
ncbi:DUF6785 family protein [Desulfospira joergensenii]|uniref:DUF6785 family protein n=1 Tax=Desulfospira joergensenii TaxID=53329 RepID=UPI0003B42424|nr:DUF6785 family protein [Desulfospira joergensenii]